MMTTKREVVEKMCGGKGHVISKFNFVLAFDLFRPLFYR